MWKGDGKASGIIVRRCLSVFDSNHRFAPTFDDAETRLLKPMPLFCHRPKRRSHPLCRAPHRGSAGASRWTASPLKPASGIIFAAGDAVTGPSSVSAPLQGGGRRPFPLIACSRAPTCTASVRKSVPLRKNCLVKACAPRPGMSGNAALFLVLRNVVSALIILTPLMKVCVA
mgnify:CR=1 FL=1